MANRKLSIGCVLIMGGAMTNCGGVVETRGDDAGGDAGSGFVGVPPSYGGGFTGTIEPAGSGNTPGTGVIGSGAAGSGVMGTGVTGVGGYFGGFAGAPGIPPIGIDAGGASGDGNWGGNGNAGGDGNWAGDRNSAGDGAVGTAPIAGDHG